MLSAGGVRGAYQVGVLDGIVEVLGLRRVASGTPLFDIFAGTSIGALNAAYLAANAHFADHAIDGLADAWSNLDLAELLRFTPLHEWGRARWHGSARPRPAPAYLGRSLLDPRPLEALVERVIAWDRLHDNVQRGVVRACMVAALDLADAHTTLFAELSPAMSLRPAAYPALRTIEAPITAERVLASTALPVLFPARNVDGHYYVDGAIRFPTPISPALHAGAERVVVVSLLHRPPRPVDQPPHYPSVAYLLGKILNALLLDPVVYDLENLLRINRAFEAISEVLTPDELARVAGRLDREQVLPHRSVPVLVFRPSEDIGRITAEFIHGELHTTRAGALRRRLIRWYSASRVGQEADLASILLLDGRLAARLIELGRRDAHALAGQIVEFFAARGELPAEAARTRMV